MYKRQRQNNPYRLGAAPAGVVGARSRCCIAENAKKKQHKIINRNTELCHHRKSSTEKRSSAIIVHEAKRTATSTRTTHTRQNNPYRLGAAPAGVGGARSRCCPAATVPAAVLLKLLKKNKIACGVRCCIAEIAKKKQHKIINRSTELCHYRKSSTENRAQPSSSTKRSAQERVREQHTQGRRIPTGLAPRRQE